MEMTTKPTSLKHAKTTSTKFANNRNLQTGYLLIFRRLDGFYIGMYQEFQEDIGDILENPYTKDGSVLVAKKHVTDYRWTEKQISYTDQKNRCIIW